MARGHEVSTQGAEGPFALPLSQVLYSEVEMSRSVLVGKRLLACWKEPVMVPSLPVSLVASRGPTNTKVESSPDYSGWDGGESTVSWSSGWEDIRRLIPFSCDESSVVQERVHQPGQQPVQQSINNIRERRVKKKKIGGRN